MSKFSQQEYEFLKKQHVGRLATNTKERVPHVAAVSYANDEDLIYISTDYESKKGRNIRRNNKVAFIVDDYINWEKTIGVIIEGEANFTIKGSFFRNGKNLLYEKYPKWERDYPLTEEQSYVLIIKPTNIISWGL